MKNGIDYIKHVRSKPGKELGKEVQGMVAVGGTTVIGLGSMMAGMLFGFEIDIDWLPGNDINHDGQWNGEDEYMLGYLFGVPAMGAALSAGAGWLARKGIEGYLSHKAITPRDREFFAVHGSLAELVKNDQYMSQPEFGGLSKVYKDALRIDRLTNHLTKGHVASVKEILGQFDEYEARCFAQQVLRSHLAGLDIEELDGYDVLLREVDLVRIAESYLEQDRPAEAEAMANDPRVSADAREELLRSLACQYVQADELEEAERVATLDRVTRETTMPLLNDIAQRYLSQGNLGKAEELWWKTNNREQLRGPLLEAYKRKGNNRKVADLFSRTI